MTLRQLIERRTKLLERPLLDVRGHARHDVPRKAAHDGGLVGGQWQAANHITDDRGESVAIVKTEWREPMTSAAKLHGILQRHWLAMAALPKLLCPVVPIRCRLVQRILRSAKHRVLRADKLPRVCCQPCPRASHDSTAAFFCLRLGGLQLIHANALEIPLARSRINRFGGKAILNRQRVLHHALENGVSKQLRINRRFHGGIIRRVPTVRNAAVTADDQGCSSTH